MDRIGRYRIVGEVGRGAIGVVYQANDPAIGRDVASCAGIAQFVEVLLKLRDLSPTESVQIHETTAFLKETLE